MKLRYIVSLALAACLVLLAACGGAEVPSSPPPESPVSVSEAPPEPASPAAPAPEASASRPASQPEPEPPGLTPAPGVEVKTLLTWEPGSRRVEVPFPARGGRLLVEVYGKEYSDSALLGFDLETGEAEADFVSMRGESGKSWDLRQAFDEEWAFKSFSADGYHHTGWSQGGEGSYSLPNYFLKEGKAVSLKDRKMYGGVWDWDAQPEKDLLTWTSPEGLWLAAADGSGARLILATERIGEQPAFAQLVEDCKNLPAEMAVTFMSPRLMDGGRVIAVDFGSPGSQMLHWGLAVLDIATGNVVWYDPFVLMTGEELEYLDDTTLLAGMTKIDVTTGETEHVWRWDLTDVNPIFSGDFVHFFGTEDTRPGEHQLFACTMTGWPEREPVLTAAGYERLYPFLRSAIDARRVVCEYETSEEAGLLLVTLPE